MVDCWLQVRYADALFAQSQGKINVTLGDHRQDRADQRDLAAIRALAQARRLLVQVVQVHVAERHVNVAQMVDGSRS